MNPSHDGGIVHGPHIYGKRTDGSMGYMPAPEPESLGAESGPQLLPNKKDAVPVVPIPALKATK